MGNVFIVSYSISTNYQSQKVIVKLTNQGQQLCDIFYVGIGFILAFNEVFLQKVQIISHTSLHNTFCLQKVRLVVSNTSVYNANEHVDQQGFFYP